MESLWVQIIIGLLTLTGNIVAVLVILARKLPGAAQSNGGRQDALNIGLQRQADKGLSTTKTLEERFDTQVNLCGERWLDQARLEGSIEERLKNIEGYMKGISDKLDKK